MIIRDNPIAARTMGINTAAYKSLTFGMSGFYTGIAGALGAIVAEFVAPDSFTFFLAVWFWWAWLLVAWRRSRRRSLAACSSSTDRTSRKKL